MKMGWQRWPCHWPCFSPDTTLLDVFFCVYVKDAIYVTPLPATLVDHELLQLQVHLPCLLNLNTGMILAQLLTALLSTPLHC